MRKNLAIIAITGLVLVSGAGVAIASISQSSEPVYSSPALCVNESTGAVNAYGFGKCPAYPASVLVAIPEVTVTPTPSVSVSASPSVSAGNQVTVTKPPKQSNAQGATGIDLPVQATDSAADQVLTFKMTNAPVGLVIDPATGVITGTIASTDAVETYAVTVTAVDTTGAYGSVTFDWTVTAAS
jgi:hypothetical protein